MEDTKFLESAKTFYENVEKYQIDKPMNLKLEELHRMNCDCVFKWIAYCFETEKVTYVDGVR